ncbi:hypothetical protein HJ203_22500 [Vibrio parahaemolyticus]|uniref:hypothetical protein n=1 Tax=Vibrio parahaemolyticus TaxID=670 RepID=UPI0011220790|nr:hypothetical protein [Vibrio parahaemolyticus]MBE3731343.1 hypothetical protein [Vibrio parahaemolyticus]MBE4171337.1 hypothetical protein [Vibrio parahaemolyticus]MBM5014408.1 hypothetical protein [Vibrio parahaemolyticus]MCR9712622.1 hypothetical protein [Vibrio parahaemolyticus]MCR9757989.1 hypothetical protein [Vibrio parahaemolyticus]
MSSNDCKLNFWGFWFPVVLCLIISVASVYIDFWIKIKGDWLQRSGAIITILGAWITFYGSKFEMVVTGSTLNINTKLPFNIWSLIIVFVGTILSGYGDLIVVLVKALA